MAKIIGILGGMGPEATGDLFWKIIKATPAKKDQDHLRIIIDNNPQIPDRTAAILAGGPDPVPAMVETARNLAGAGAELLVIPCNTAHYYYDRITAALPIPILHIVRETADYVRKKYPAVRTVGLLATTGTIRTRLYHDGLAAAGYTVLTPPDPVQEEVMAAIYGSDGIKAGHLAGPAEVMRRAAGVLIEAGAEAVICGCTEIPLVLHDGDIPVPVLDPTAVLAAAAVREARRE
ncbi:MAG: aspartate/glutamate racemase family protein [bacterium]